MLSTKQLTTCAPTGSQRVRAPSDGVIVLPDQAGCVSEQTNATEEIQIVRRVVFLKLAKCL